jgi:L-alanine-DL-glutamate epimerase-like enolase superfamily enzyme
VTVSNAKADFRIKDGEMMLPSGPGLGVEVDIEALGERVFAATA